MLTNWSADDSPNQCQETDDLSVDNRKFVSSHSLEESGVLHFTNLARYSPLSPEAEFDSYIQVFVFEFFFFT